MNLIIKNYSKSILYEFIRYCTVGGIAFFCDYLILYVLTEYSGIHFLISASMGFSIGLIVNYILSKLWVFKTSHVDGLQSFLLFMIIGIVGLLITEIFMGIGVNYFNLHYLIVKFGVAFLVLIWNYTARKVFVFNNFL